MKSLKNKIGKVKGGCKESLRRTASCFTKSFLSEAEIKLITQIKRLMDNNTHWNAIDSPRKTSFDSILLL